MENMFQNVSQKRKETQNSIIEMAEKSVKTEKKDKIPQSEGKKMISAQVNISVYEKFTEINKKAGLKNNSVLNNLIWQYVEKHDSEI